MTVCIVMGGGGDFAKALAAALAGPGVTVLVPERLAPQPQEGAFGEALCRAAESLLSLAMPREILAPTQLAGPLPFPAESAKNLRKSEISQVAPRSLPRPREQRTRGKR